MNLPLITKEQYFNDKYKKKFESIGYSELLQYGNGLYYDSMCIFKVEEMTTATGKISLVYTNLDAELNPASYEIRRTSSTILPSQSRWASGGRIILERKKLKVRDIL